ncbi:MAG: carbohydrate ABC transporter permease [Spirochaetia bacterium]
MIEAKRSALWGNIFKHTVLGILAVICVVPLISVVSISFTDEASIIERGYGVFPRETSIRAYEIILRNPARILQSYYITISVTFVGTLSSLLVISLVAFPMARKDYRFRRPLTFYVFFTMLFNGGLVPWYILIARYLQLKNTFFVLFLPWLVIPWFVLLLRTFFTQLPFSLFESAKMDGASEFRMYAQILLPLSKPALATVGLFIALHLWNDWWLPLLYIDVERLIPLQFMLQRMMANFDYLTKQMTTASLSVDISELPGESARMAMCVLAAGPMLFIFPFFQKYFVRGLTAGSLKG